MTTFHLPRLLAVASLSLAATLSVAPATALADPAPKIVKKVPPDFPGEATRKGITDGVLKAKLSIDGNGAVTEVAIVEATPPKAKIFNDAATTALAQWKFEAGGKPTTYELKLVFSQE
ncbi:MAG: energy transducer TonB [Vitreoscilla sp.]|nr:energy transducer TonB [Vitreoscilla sp.]